MPELEFGCIYTGKITEVLDRQANTSFIGSNYSAANLSRGHICFGLYLAFIETQPWYPKVGKMQQVFFSTVLMCARCRGVMLQLHEGISPVLLHNSQIRSFPQSHAFFTAVPGLWIRN